MLLWRMVLLVQEQLAAWQLTRWWKRVLKGTAGGWAAGAPGEPGIRTDLKALSLQGATRLEPSALDAIAADETIACDTTAADETTASAPGPYADLVTRPRDHASIPGLGARPRDQDSGPGASSRQVTPGGGPRGQEGARRRQGQPRRDPRSQNTFF